MMTTTPATTPRSTYLPAIDGLRAFAVGAVLLFHADHMSGGFLGVDTFFVLSGFLITRQMLQEVDKTGRVSLRAFWSRRARRLLPALLLLLAVVTLVGAEWGLAQERLAIRDETPWALGFVLNWHHIAASTDYWTSLSSPSPLTHLWSLAVEEQFYLVWPLVVVLLIWRRSNRERSVLIGSFVGAALSFGLMAIVYSPTSSTRAYEGTDTRIGALLVGAMCATVIVTDRADAVVSRLGRYTSLAVLAPTAVLAWMWLRVDGRDSWLYHGGFLLHAALVAAVLLGVSSMAGTNWLQGLLRQRPLRWMGQLSYGLYLWHWPIYVALSPARTDLSRWPLTALRLGVTFVAATISFYAIERPIRYGLQRRPVTLTAVASVAGIALMVVAVVVVPLPDAKPAPINLASLTVPAADAGAAATTTAAVAPSPTTTVDATAGSTATTAGSAAPSPTTTTLAATTTTAPAPLTDVHEVVWFGDSIAFTTSLGLAAAMKAIGIDVVDSSFPGVGLLNETGPTSFAKITDLTDTLHPQLLILQMSTWDEPFGVDAIYAAIARIRDITSAVGAHLLLLPVPPLRADQDHSGYQSDFDAAQKLATDDPVNVSFLDTAPFWGSTFELDMDGDKIPERMGDGVHLCPSGTAKFAIWLITQLSTRYANVSVADPALWATGDWTQDSRYARISGACSVLP